VDGGNPRQTSTTWAARKGLLSLVNLLTAHCLKPAQKLLLNCSILAQFLQYQDATFLPQDCAVIA